jgi:hypothetical protein
MEGNKWIAAPFSTARNDERERKLCMKIYELPSVMKKQEMRNNNYLLFLRFFRHCERSAAIPLTMAKNAVSHTIMAQ